MIGSLTIDKASMNISFFLKTLLIISEHGNSVSRYDFVEEMSDFIGLQGHVNGRENRTPYNKSKLPRYFGFVTNEKTFNEDNLVLTNRGKIAVEYISENKNADANSRYFISKEHRADFVNLIIQSLVYDSFGKYNAGAETSNTDVEPPKIVFKSIYDLGKATAEEICYIIFGLNNGTFKTYEEAIETIKGNRAYYIYDYSEIMEKWGKTNIVNDCKIVNIFLNESIGLLKCERDQEKGKNYYSLSLSISKENLISISNLNPIYRPVREFLNANNFNMQTINSFINVAILGSSYNDSRVFRITENSRLLASVENGRYIPGELEKAFLSAFQNKKDKTTIIIEGSDPDVIMSKLGKYEKLFYPIDDLQSDYNCWSREEIYDDYLYKYITTNCKEAANLLNKNKFRIPSNLQLVGIVT